MSKVLIIDDDPGCLTIFERILERAGYEVHSAGSGYEGLQQLRRRHLDLVLTDLSLPDISGLEVMRLAAGLNRTLPFLVVTGCGTVRDAVSAIRLGAADVLEKPLTPDALLGAVAWVLRRSHDRTAVRYDLLSAVEPEAHAAARWARALVPILDAPRDPRTVAAWGRHIAASQGALRNWCRTAQISPRRSLLLGRMLRAVYLSDNGRHGPESLLDIVDRRTLAGLLRLAGLDGEAGFPTTVDEFIERQRLVCDTTALREIRSELDRRRAMTLPLHTG